MDIKRFGGRTTEVKEEVRDGVNIGIVAGYIATWDVDRGDYYYKDQFVKGSFADSIKEFKKNQRMPRFKDSHRRTIGGWRFETLKEDERGLFGEAEINLDVQQGREAYAMAKQGVLTDFSVGFSADEFTIDEIKKLRTITSATLWEGSIVDEPMNPNANITDVKCATKFTDLPIADKATEWDPKEALKRVDAGMDSKTIDHDHYANSFLFSKKVSEDGKYQSEILFSDVIDGKLTVIPKGILAASIELIKVNTGSEQVDTNTIEAETHIGSYYKKMGRESPFSGKCLIIDAIDANNLTVKQFEDILTIGCVKFTDKGKKAIISNIKSAPPRDAEGEGRRDAEEKAERIGRKMDQLITLMEKK